MPNTSLITHWTASVSKETDISVRSFLARRGMKKGDLSKFIEAAAKWYLDQQMTDEKESNSSTEQQNTPKPTAKDVPGSRNEIIRGRNHRNVSR